MKIGIVCYPTYGGSGVIATELGLGLAKQGHHVHFFSYRMPVRLSHFQKNVWFHEVRPFEYALFDFAPYESTLTSRIVDVVLSEKLDVLHVHYAVPHANTAYLAKKILSDKGYHLPVITTLHGTDITLVGIDQSLSTVIEFSIEKSDAVTSVSQSLKEDTLRLFDLKKDIQVIPNFIDSQRFKETRNESLREMLTSPGDKVLMHISNFRPVKRIEDVVRCFAICQKALPAKLILVGDGPEKAKMECLSHQLGVDSDVVFLGKQESVEELLAIADLFLLCSEKESFGLVALEAMACGVPIISSDAGGIEEVNLHGKTGFVSKIGDYEDMAANAMKLLQDDQRMEEFKHNALIQANEFELDKILQEYLELYLLVTKKVPSGYSA